MSTLYLMQGMPGSGKSTVAKMIAESTWATIYSTDDYHYEDGVYVFKGHMLPEYHKRVREAVEIHMRDRGGPIIVDNTNIKRAHAEPFFKLAKQYGYDAQVIRVDPGLKTCLRRNQTRPEDRRVPEAVIRRMFYEMEHLRKPPEEKLGYILMDPVAETDAL